MNVAEIDYRIWKNEIWIWWSNFDTSLNDTPNSKSHILDTFMKRLRPEINFCYSINFLAQRVKKLFGVSSVLFGHL